MVAQEGTSNLWYRSQHGRCDLRCPHQQAALEGLGELWTPKESELLQTAELHASEHQVPGLSKQSFFVRWLEEIVSPMNFKKLRVCQMSKSWCLDLRLEKVDATISASIAPRNRLSTHDGEDGEIPVAAVLDFQRFVSDSGRLSVEFDEETIVKEEHNNVNMMLNRYSVGANLHNLTGRTNLGDLEFKSSDEES